MLRRGPENFEDEMLEDDYYESEAGDSEIYFSDDSDFEDDFDEEEFNAAFDRFFDLEQTHAHAQTRTKHDNFAPPLMLRMDRTETFPLCHECSKHTG